MKHVSEETLISIQKQLDLNCPSPESAIVKLGLCVAELPSNKEIAKLRHLILDVDDLTAQIRWHLGQALLLMDSLPDIRNAGEGDGLFKDLGMPTGALFLLRSGIVEAGRVLFDDLSTSRRGGTVGGWIFHMMIDDAVYRTVSAMDRLAAILYCAAELPVKRIYFRSGIIKKLDEVLCCDETKHLLKIAEGKLTKFIIDYRNDFTHNAKAYSRVSGIVPVEQWKDETGRLVIWNENTWDAERLLALARAAYLQFTEALGPTVGICEKKWPIRPEYLS